MVISSRHMPTRRAMHKFAKIFLEYLDFQLPLQTSLYSAVIKECNVQEPLSGGDRSGSAHKFGEMEIRNVRKMT